MTKRYQRNKGTKSFVKRKILWGSVLAALLLVIFLFPNSRPFYALTNIWPSSSSGTDQIPIGDKEDGVIAVVKPDSENKATPGIMENSDKLDGSKEAKSELESKPEAKSESTPGNGNENQGTQSSNASQNPNSSLVGETSEPNREIGTKATVFRGNPQVGKKVALTFDDGPYEIWTAEYLKLLEEYEVPAAFFLVGTRVEKYQEITRKIANKGFDLGSHSYRHGRLTLFKSEKLNEDFRKTIAAINLFGDVKYFRPPYGDYNQVVVDTAAKHGLKTVCWNVDPRDWELEDSGKIVERVLSHTKDGSIILLHEGRKSTLAALPGIITGLRDKGYQLVKISELMK